MPGSICSPRKLSMFFPLALPFYNFYKFSSLPSSSVQSCPTKVLHSLMQPLQVLLGCPKHDKRVLMAQCCAWPSKGREYDPAVVCRCPALPPITHKENKALEQILSPNWSSSTSMIVRERVYLTSRSRNLQNCRYPKKYMKIYGVKCNHNCYCKSSSHHLQICWVFPEPQNWSK